MAITVTCKCGQSHQVRDQFAGHETNCPYCGKPITIPNIENAEETLTRPPSVVESRSLEKEEMVEPPVRQDIQPETFSSAEQEPTTVPTRSGTRRPVEPIAPEQQQAKFGGSEDKEICANCGRQMPSSEQACVFNGKIVCARCNKKLRRKSKPTVTGIIIIILGGCIALVGILGYMFSQVALHGIAERQLLFESPFIGPHDTVSGHSRSQDRTQRVKIEKRLRYFRFLPFLGFCTMACGSFFRVKREEASG